MPLLAGLAGVMPWVRQWHGEVDPDFGMSHADAYDGYLTDQRESRSLTEDDLRTWTPAPSAGEAASGKSRAVGDAACSSTSGPKMAI